MAGLSNTFPKARPHPAGLSSFQESLQLQPSTALLDQNAVAAMLGLKPRTLEDWRCTGHGPHFVRLSRRCVRYDAAVVLAWVKSQETSSTAAAAPEAA